jgi:hypothetical protein
VSSDSATRLLGDTALGLPPFAVRAARLARSERASYLRILQRTIEGTQNALEGLPAAQISSLIEADLIQTNRDGRLTVAYPFSVQPTRHRVTMDGGRSFQAMCAIDALGVPYMLGACGEVNSREPDAHQTVRVSVDPDGEPTWTPAAAVAAAASSEGCCLAQAACPHINLFASPDAATRYLDTHRLRGSVLSVAEAVAAGRALFGNLLPSLAETAAR